MPSMPWPLWWRQVPDEALGYHTNLMVAGPGGYRLVDYVKFGLAGGDHRRHGNPQPIVIFPLTPA